MFTLIQEKHYLLLDTFVSGIPRGNRTASAQEIEALLNAIHADIPEKKRASYGRYSIVKRLGKEVYNALLEASLDPFEVALVLFLECEIDSFVRAMGVQLITLYAEKTGDLATVLPQIELAADDSDWIVRECTQGYIKKVVKKYPSEMKQWYLTMVSSPSPNKRRFVSESLRPVTENKWMIQDPDYPLSIISHLLEESDAYPRSSVGNNLSDWFRVNECITWPIVEQLAQSSNEHARWIAYRACRNVVKKSPARVMQMLGIGEYKYKNRHYLL